MLQLALKLICVTFAFLTLLGPENVVVGQPIGSFLDIRAYGVDIPPGEVVAGDDAVVRTRDRYGDRVLARVHVNVGENRVVLLPDGQLVARHQRETKVVDETFKKADMVQLGKQLIEHEFSGFRVKRTVHYIYIYNTSESFATATSKILEMMTARNYRLYEKLGVRS